VAKAFLDTKPAASTKPVTLPARFAARGYHATTYTVAWDAAAAEYRIALAGLAPR
jgi:hypothetical protein